MLTLSPRAVLFSVLAAYMSLCIIVYDDVLFTATPSRALPAEICYASETSPSFCLEPGDPDVSGRVAFTLPGDHMGHLYYTPTTPATDAAFERGLMAAKFIIVANVAAVAAMLGILIVDHFANDGRIADRIIALASVTGAENLRVGEQ